MSSIDLTELQSADFSVLMHHDLAHIIQRLLPLDVEIEDAYCEIMRHAKWVICVGVLRTRQIVGVNIGFDFFGHSIRVEVHLSPCGLILDIAEDAQ
jgi:Tfp pilus assembly ATPase PilU